jgi:WD40 repeat protein
MGRRDGTARLWDAKSGKPSALLLGHDGAVMSAAFSPDAKTVVTASRDKTARLWDVTWVTEMHGAPLRERVCAEKLIGAQDFTPPELNDQILSGFTQTRPCQRRGPLSLDYGSNRRGSAR